ncbi:YbgA family protein [Streptococcus cameli]
MRAFQKDWAYHKYWVMGHSQAHYNALRLLFKGNDWSQEKAEQYQQLLKEAGQLSPSKATLTTSYQHMWGYFKKKASPEEKETYKFLIEAVRPKKDDLKPFILQLIDKYQPAYLVRSKFYDDKGF